LRYFNISKEQKNMLLKAALCTESKKEVTSPSIKLLLLSVLMLATRTDHFGSAISLPDASLAVFFLAAFYFRRLAGFILLCVLAAGIDYWAISARGVSDYCVTAAYGFLLPSYFSVWWAGRWAGANMGDKLLVISITVLSLLVAFFISNGSFYLFSGYFSDLNLAQYSSRVAQYLPRYLLVPLGYLAVAALLHFLLAQRAERQAHSHD
jgi:hypothetical protein